MKLGCWITLIVVVVLVVGVVFFVRYVKMNAPLSVTVGTVTKEEFVHEVSGTGTVDAHVYSLTFTTPGRVAHVDVKENDIVKAGEVVADLDLSSERDTLRAAQDTLTARQAALTTADEKARADRTKMEGDLADAQKKLRLAQDLLKVGGESQDDVHDDQRAVDTQESDLRTFDETTASNREDLLSQIRQQQAQISTASEALKEGQLRAPVDGVISQVDFRAGEVATGAISLVETNTLRVKAQIQESDADLLKVGMPGTIELDAAPDHPLMLTVSELGATATAQGEGGSATLLTKLTFDTADAAAIARPGYTGTVRITVQKLGVSVQAPLEAIVDESADGGHRYYVWVATPKTGTGSTVPVPGGSSSGTPRPVVGTVQRREVTVSARNLTKAVIPDLPVGTLVVTLPPDKLTNGAMVIWTPEEASSSTP